MENKKKLLIIFLSIYLIIGSLNSIKTGISFDEYFEQRVWNFHKQLVIDLKNKFIHGEEFNKKNKSLSTNLVVHTKIVNMIQKDIQFPKLRKLSILNKLEITNTKKTMVRFLSAIL